jgi:hypothetical protein
VKSLRPKEGTINDTSDLHNRGSSEEGGGEGVQACHHTLA